MKRGRYHEQIVIRSAPVVADPYNGNESRDWAHATDSSPVPADVQPAGLQELLDSRQVTISQYTVICSPASIAAVDRIVWQGGVYEVDGEVGRYFRHGTLHHLEFSMKHYSE
jgi:hypothetical protein